MKVITELDEMQYFQWLENKIKILGSNKLSEVLLSNYGRELGNKFDIRIIDMIDKKVSKKDIVKLLDGKQKGLAILTKDSEGKLFLFYNARNRILGKNEIFVRPIKNEEANKKNLYRYILKAILDNDVKHTVARIRKENLQKKSQKQYESMFSTEKPPKHSYKASSLESEFKKQIKEGGFSVDPMRLMYHMVRQMPASEKKKTHLMLSSMNIKNDGELKELLLKWRSEALYVRPQIRMDKTQTRGIGM